MAMLDWEKASGSDSTSQRQCIPLHCWGFYRVLHLFQLDHQGGDYGDWQSNNLHVSWLPFCVWRPLNGKCHWRLWNWLCGGHNTVLYTFISGGYITLDCPQALPLFQTISFPYPLLNMLQKHIHSRSWGGLSAMSSRRVSTHPGRGKSLVAGSGQVCSPCSRLQTTLWLWPQHAENLDPEAFCPWKWLSDSDNFSAFLHSAQCSLPLS